MTIYTSSSCDPPTNGIQKVYQGRCLIERNVKLYKHKRRFHSKRSWGIGMPRYKVFIIVSYVIENYVTTCHMSRHKLYFIFMHIYNQYNLHKFVLVCKNIDIIINKFSDNNINNNMMVFHFFS